MTKFFTKFNTKIALNGLTSLDDSVIMYILDETILYFTGVSKYTIMLKKKMVLRCISMLIL